MDLGLSDDEIFDVVMAAAGRRFFGNPLGGTLSSTRSFGMRSPPDGRPPTADGRAS